jgi:2-keto-4-pentenoate hydratase/2-oxohepta-3-ene-1,7-dioic acid hydratase in catechol pathway
MMQRLTTLLSTAIVIALAVASSAICTAEQKATKYVRFEVDGQAAYGIVEGEYVRRLKGDLFTDPVPTAARYRLSDVKLLVPTEPSKVLAAAGNYMSHFSTQDAAAEREHKPPELFFKVPSCLIAQGEKIVLPKGSKDVHFEAELVAVIGKRARNVPVKKALDFVLGVTCGNDVSARDWQKNDVQWWRAKGHDTFGPCGPYIVSGIDCNDLMVRLRLNGEVKQEQSTCDMMNNVAQIVSFASRHVTLLPGDLIYTGTPGKTSAIKPGDVVEVEIEGVGVLRNGVTAAK